MSESVFDPGSFRDPGSRVFYRGQEVRRALSRAGRTDWEALAGTDLFRRWQEDGKLIGTRVEGSGENTVLVHDRIPFWSYPYEWSFAMLKQAALLQLDLIAAALEGGLTLKDATPYNIQFRGSDPVFIDIGSFRSYSPGEPWLGYGQFSRMFLYPLMILAHAGIPFQPLLRGSLDGIEPEQARSILRGGRLFRPGVLFDVAMQARAQRRTDSSRDLRQELNEAGFKPEMIKANLRRLHGVITRTEWQPDSSTWSDYATCEHVGSQRGPKDAFVRTVLADRHRHLVWDLGANDGHFSRIAAGSADWVVAADSDHVVIDRLFRSLRELGPQNVLPLVFDIADPSPGLGWKGQERRRLEERGQPDLILLLAVIHHLVITGNLPLTEVVDWLRSLEAEIIFEWVPMDDPMARRLAINKRPDEIHPDYREEVFRQLLAERFAIRSEAGVEGRTLFHLVPR